MSKVVAYQTVSGPILIGKEVRSGSAHIWLDNPVYLVFVQDKATQRPEARIRPINAVLPLKEEADGSTIFFTSALVCQIDLPEELEREYVKAVTGIEIARVTPQQQNSIIQTSR